MELSSEYHCVYEYLQKFYKPVEWPWFIETLTMVYVNVCFVL